MCDRPVTRTVYRARYRDCFRSTSTVDTYSRTYRGTYSLTTLTSTVTTHHKLILTSIAGRTSPRAVEARCGLLRARSRAGGSRS